MMRRTELTLELLKDLMVYEKRTGIFTRLKSAGPMKAGMVAGTLRKDGYVNIFIGRKNYAAHRLAWFYVNGQWPDYEIDHRDGNPSNNAWLNLRDATATRNKQNIHKAPASKKYSKLLGAQWFGQRNCWRSAIKVNGKRVSLGLFKTDVEAAAAYLIAKRRLHEGCTI